MVMSIITILPSWKRHRGTAAGRNWGGRSILQLSDTSHYVHGTFYFPFVWFSPLSHENWFLYLNTGILEDTQVWLCILFTWEKGFYQAWNREAFKFQYQIHSARPLPPEGHCWCPLRTIPLHQICSGTKPLLTAPHTHIQIFWRKYFNNHQFYLQIRYF